MAQVVNKALVDKYFSYDGTISIDKEGGVSFLGKMATVRLINYPEIPFNIVRATSINFNPTPSKKGSLLKFPQLPASISGSILAPNLKLTTLEGLPQSLTGIDLANNPLENLNGLPQQIGKFIRLPFIPTLGVMKLFTVNWLDTSVTNKVIFDAASYSDKKKAEQVQIILNQYLPKKNFIMCATRLTRSGFEDMAQL